jgi:hypothetical protein
MTVIEMLDIWANRSAGVAANAASMLRETKSLVVQNGRTDSWGIDLDDWEEELHDNITSSLNILIYGPGREKGILDRSEQIAVEHHHIAAVWVSNRTNIANDYERALFKLKPAMERRGFVVE